MQWLPIFTGKLVRVRLSVAISDYNRTAKKENTDERESAVFRVLSNGTTHVLHDAAVLLVAPACYVLGAPACYVDGSTPCCTTLLSCSLRRRVMVAKPKPVKIPVGGHTARLLAIG